MASVDAADALVLDDFRHRLETDVRLTRSLGGNLVRCFWSVEGVISGPAEDLAVALNSVVRHDLKHETVFLHDVDHRLAQLDRIDAVLDELSLALADEAGARFTLDFRILDALFDGLRAANADGAAPVELMLALVSSPPRWIIESPSDVTMQRTDRRYIFSSLWHRYVQFHAGLYRQIVSRYGVDRGLRAIEIFNEPDYNWTPDEVKIEGVRDRLLNPVGKYVTELMLGQVPFVDRGLRSFELGPWGFQSPDAQWTLLERPSVGVLDFDWGPKFDWYVMCAAQLQTHTARAIKEEAKSRGFEMTTVSGSVTHNNVDYLVRLQRADAAAFEHIDAIGLHPYHWVNNDVWDDRFVRDDAPNGWARAHPREYADEYFKRFDFLRVLAGEGSSGDSSVDRELIALMGDRDVWVTEFGIGTKILQGVHADDPLRNRLIRPRSVVGASGGHPDVVWEDLWEAFLDQVDGSWLSRHNIGCFLLYGPRELDRPGLDLHDDDRTNLALFARDGAPRLEAHLVDRLGIVMGDVTGRTAGRWARSTESIVPGLLYRRPWRGQTLSSRARDVKTMLSIEERQLLQWLTAQYYNGEGAIVDGGPFVGGSTVPLAEGLLSAGRSDMIDVYDRFEVEPYMSEMYFQHEGLVGGESFLPVFERNTAHVAQMLSVHAGDLLSKSWRGDPIEILFVDCSKTWELNDFIVSEFFPSLIPGRAIVVQQDFVFALCPWVALTMEYLADHFQPVGFAEQCSVVYVTRSAVPRNLMRVSELPTDRQFELIDQAIARFRGYLRGVLECAKAMLCISQGDIERADAITLAVADRESEPHFAVAAALEQVAKSARGS
jgi:hypothetical protein